MQSGDDVRFLHHSFAEILGAISMAGEIDSEYSELDRWIERGLKEAERTLVLFLFAIWSTGQGGDARVVIERLLGGSRKHLSLAAALVAELPEVDPDLARQVIDRMIDLSLGKQSTAPLRELRRIRCNDHLTVRLVELARHRGLKMAPRIEACIALGHASLPTEAVALMRELEPDTAGRGITQLAAGYLDLVPDDLPAVETQLRRLMEADRGTAKDLCEAARLLTEHGRTAASLEIIESAVRLSEPDGSDLPDIVRQRLAVGDAAAFDAVLELMGRYPSMALRTRANLADVLAEFGHTRVAVGQATSVVRSEEADYSAFWDAVDVLLEASDAPAHELVDTVRAAKQLHPGNLALLLEKLADHGHTELVAALARPMVTNSAFYANSLAKVVKVWLIAAGADELDAVLSSVESRASLTPYDLAKIARELAELGYTDAAGVYARRVLSAEYADLFDVSDALRVVASLGDADALGAALDQVLAGRAWTTSCLADLAESLVEVAPEAIVRRLARQVLDDPIASFDDITTAVTSWLTLGGSRAAEEIGDDYLSDRSRYSTHVIIASAMIKEGFLGLGRAALLGAVSGGRLAPGFWRMQAGQLLADCGDAALAVAAIEERLADGTFADADAGTKVDVLAVLAYLRARVPSD